MSRLRHHRNLSINVIVIVALWTPVVLVFQTVVADRLPLTLLEVKMSASSGQLNHIGEYHRRSRRAVSSASQLTIVNKLNDIRRSVGASDMYYAVIIIVVLSKHAILILSELTSATTPRQINNRPTNNANNDTTNNNIEWTTCLTV